MEAPLFFFQRSKPLLKGSVKKFPSLGISFLGLLTEFFFLDDEPLLAYWQAVSISIFSTLRMKIKLERKIPVQAAIFGDLNRENIFISNLLYEASIPLRNSQVLASDGMNNLSSGECRSLIVGPIEMVSSPPQRSLMMPHSSPP